MLQKSVFVAVAAVTIVTALSEVANLVAAADSSPAALTGLVSSQEEGATAPHRAGAMGTPLEGVLVSAKRAGSTITVTVVSDAQGRYS